MTKMTMLLTPPQLIFGNSHTNLVTGTSRVGFSSGPSSLSGGFWLAEWLHHITPVGYCRWYSLSQGRL